MSTPWWKAGQRLNQPVDAHLIELRVDDARNLFETLDPFPFGERDIDRNAENYILSWARELQGDAPWKIVIHLPDAHAHDALAQELSTAFARFFRERAETATMDLRELFRVGRFSVALGLAVLVTTVVAAQQMERFIAPGSLERTIEESFVILGWVANWRPLEIVMYDWLPIIRRRTLYRKLAAAKVELRPTGNRSTQTSGGGVLAT